MTSVEVASVIDYGAVGNGTTDCTTAIANAIAAVGSYGTVYFPPGVFAHTGIIVPTGSAGVSIAGAGVAMTTLKNTHASNASVTLHGAGAGSYIPGTMLRDLTITATAVHSGQVGVDVLLAQSFDVTRVEIRNHGVGLSHRASWENLYQDVHIHNCTIGWQFPAPGVYTASCPVTLVGCHAGDCGTGVIVADGLQAMSWVGGDLARCGVGVVLDGSQTGQLSFIGLNFEGITGDDISVGSTAGPAGVTFNGCRFFYQAGSKTRSVHFTIGDQLQFINCRWTGYTLVARQENTSGAMTMVGCGGYGYTHFIDLDGVYSDTSPVLVSSAGGGISGYGPGGNSLTGTTRASQWLATKVLYGAGKVTVSDGDFSTAPVEGSMCGVYNTSDSTFSGSRSATTGHGRSQGLLRKRRYLRRVRG